MKASASEVLITSRGDIYRLALERYGAICPKRKPLETVAPLINISTKKLSRALHNEAILDVVEEEMLFHVTMFPEGFDLKKQLLFPQLEGRK